MLSTRQALKYHPEEIVEWINVTEHSNIGKQY